MLWLWPTFEQVKSNLKQFLSCSYLPHPKMHSLQLQLRTDLTECAQNALDFDTDHRTIQ